MGTIVTTRSAVICWVDARGARLVRWTDGPAIERIVAEIPSRHVSTGHVRHDPLVRQGGGGAAQDRIARDREGHIREYVAAIAGAIHDDEDVEVLGPTGIREELAQLLREDDRHHGRDRHVGTAPAIRLSDGQLVARLRARIGQAPHRVERRQIH